MGRLKDLMGGADDYFDDWQSVERAGELGVVPAGKYECRLARGKLGRTPKTGTPHYLLDFVVAAGDCKDRHLWYPIWLTPKAKKQAARDFDKLRITDPKNQLDGPLPEGIICECDVVLQKRDDGAEYSQVRSFSFLRVDEPAPNPFPPATEADGSLGGGF